MNNTEVQALPPPIPGLEGRNHSYRVKCVGADNQFTIFESANSAAAKLGVSVSSILKHARTQGLTSFKGYYWFLVQ